MLLVSDREDTQDLPGFVGRERLFICSLDVATASEDDVVVIDVDLEDRFKRKHLKRLFRDIKPRRALAIAVDLASVAQRHTAQTLGATTLLGRPVTSGMLHRFIHRLEPGHNPAPIEDAITQGATALADAFSAVRHAGALDLPAIRLAASDIADAVAQFDTTTWLASVAASCDSAFRHSLTTAGLASAFARQIGMNASDIILLTTAALLLDIGTADLPRSLFDKSEPLSADEEALLHRHPADAADYLDAHSDLPNSVLDAIRHHHEFLDGSGYPDGIGAKRLNDLTGVMTVCDLLAGLLDRHRHDPALTPTEALDVLAVMARENKIGAGPVAVFEAAFSGTVGQPGEASRHVA